MFICELWTAYYILHDWLSWSLDLFFLLSGLTNETCKIGEE